MNPSTLKATLLIATGFAAGLLVANLPKAVANTEDSPPDIAQKEFMVSIDEIQQNVVFGERFTGMYEREVTMSNGKIRKIQLVPMIRDGKKTVLFKDNGHYSYMGLNGTTTNGTLMVQLRDVAEMKRQLREQGWER
ncbi:MAG: hypothetical protein AB7E72_06050 [Lysobacterales bacterium]